ncbi:MAG: hypothetical protein ACI8WB_002759 [Phenylobacterium sp.]|jgi:hypothetical protein
MEIETKSIDNAFLYKRVQSILYGLELDNALTITTNEASSLTDHELLEQLFNIHTHHTFRNHKMVKRLEQKREGQKKFMAFLGGFGGCEKQSKYAQLSGISRQNVYNRIKKGTLVVVNEANVPLVPLFQLDEQTSDEIYGLSQVNLVLEQAQLSGAMKCTFWLNPHSGLNDLSPRDYLRQNKGSEDALEQVLKFAHRSGHQGY